MASAARTTRLPRIDAVLSVVFALLFGLFMWVALAPSKGVDAGILHGFIAVFYLGPCAVLLGLSALSQSRQWRFRQAIRWLAIAFVVLPPACIILYGLAGHPL